MSLTLVEAAKLALNEGKEKLATVILQYAESSGVLENLPFRNIAGNAFTYNREETLPGIGFRGINESYSESTGIVNPVTETLSISGGDLDVDNFLIQTLGAGTRSSQEMMKVKALSLSWTNTFVNGDTATNPKEFDGIKKRLTGTQLVSAGATSGGDVLSLERLDALIDQVDEPTHIIMNKTMRRRLTAASRNTGVGGYITFEQDQFGRRVEMYQGLPIVVLQEDNERNLILPFTEAGEGGGTAQCSSIYCVSFDDMGLTGIQSGGIDVRDLGELDTKPAMRTRVEWYAGLAILQPRAAARLYGVKDGAVVA
jgi:hypothetical protein